MAQPKHNPESLPPLGNNADIIPFKARRGAEEIDPAELSDAECVSFFVQKWNHPAFSGKLLADTINADLAATDGADAWQERLQGIVHKSPLFDFYDELLVTDPPTRLLDVSMRSAVSEPGEGMSGEKKAFSSLMDMRAAEIIEHPGEPLAPQLARLPLGDERFWESMIERLNKQE